MASDSALREEVERELNKEGLRVGAVRSISIWNALVDARLEVRQLTDKNAQQLADLKDDFKWLQQISSALNRHRTRPDDLDSMLNEIRHQQKDLLDSQVEVRQLRERIRKANICTCADCLAKEARRRPKK